ncbi:hypothetical protein Axi01nite_72700 [Actinoplanes xinjiangensis]|nr:hypothetical protein Axi01nite_72700 [Actinoplanes xinjiangensis]
MKGPVPGPSSTTSGSPVSGTAAAIFLATGGGLGMIAAVRIGCRRNSRRNMPRSLFMIRHPVPLEFGMHAVAD